MTEKVKGGIADKLRLKDIAKKHNVDISVIEEQFELGTKVEMEHTDSKEIAKEIAKDHIFEIVDYYTKLDKMEEKDSKGGFFTKSELEEKTNSKDWAKTYKATSFIEKGVCTYKDETIYISQDTLNKAIQSIKGRPVVIQHQKVTPENMESHAVGYVSGCGFSECDASFNCDFLVFDDKGKEVIARDYSVSCAYLPKSFGQGGTWHNTPYNREVTELEFTHLALVPDPRYEDAKIYENSKDKDDTKENYNMEKIEVEQGFLASLLEIAQKPFLNAKEEPKKEDPKDKKVDDDELKYEGKKYSKKELVNAFTKGEEKKEPEDKKEEKEKTNSKEEKEPTAKEIEFYNSMKAKMEATKEDPNDKIQVHTQKEGLELGSKIFG